MNAPHRPRVQLALAALALALGGAVIVLSASPSARAAGPAPGADQPAKPIPTSAPLPSVTPTPAPTPTPKPSGNIPTPSPSPAPTATPVPPAKPGGPNPLPTPSATPSATATPTATPKPRPDLPDLTVVQECAPAVLESDQSTTCTVTVTNSGIAAAAIVPQNVQLVVDTFFRDPFTTGMGPTGYMAPSGYGCEWDLLDYLDYRCTRTVPAGDVIAPGESRVFTFGVSYWLFGGPAQSFDTLAVANPNCTTSSTPPSGIVERDCTNNSHLGTITVNPP